MNETAASVRAILAHFPRQYDAVAQLLAGATNARYFERTGSRTTKGAYRKGVEAALAGQPNEHPYRKQLPNFLRGDNDPRDAWKMGWFDGDRVRKMIANPSEDFPGLTFREAKILSEAGLLIASTEARNEAAV